MPSTILFEAHNLTLAAGTGIATYARQLASTARGLGYGAQALVGLRTGLDRRDPVLSEIQLFDASRKPTWTPSSWTRNALSFLAGSPLGIQAFPLPSGGVVISPSPGQFSAFDETYAATMPFDRGLQHLNRWGTRATLKLPTAPQLFHMTHPAALKARGCPNIVTIHDIVPLRLPYTTLDDKKLTLKLLRTLCREADHIVTVSEFSKRDIMSFFDLPEERITNTYQCVSLPEKAVGRSQDQVAEDLRNGFELEPGGYFLFYGAIEPKKNVRRLVEAYAESGASAPLVLVGALGWQYEKDVEAIEDERFVDFAIKGERIAKRRRVRRLPYVPFTQLVSLIRGARAVIFPSIYEGFGLPVLEAMSLGAPVITSNVSSLPEIAGDAALLIDPTKIEEIAQAIRTIDLDADLRAELSRRGPLRAADFSPEIYAERLKTLYARLM